MSEVSVKELGSVLLNLMEFVRVQPSQEGLCVVFREMFVTFFERSRILFDVSRHFKVKRWKC